jgi:hypothetical protein
MKYAFLLTIAVLLPASTLAKVTPETCASFYQALEKVPHESIFQQDGLFSSQGFEVGVNGCLVVMVTDEVRMNGHSLPEFSADPGTPLHKAGWRSDTKYIADAPGTGVVGLVKDSTLCLVYTEQQSYLDDSGNIAQNGFVHSRVECLDVVQGECPVALMCE